MKALVVFGTRPEAIKMCPLVLALSHDPAVDARVCVTGQHREMLDQVLDIFKVEPDHDLSIMRPGQTLGLITTSVIEKMEPVLEEEKPDVVLVHGDTTTSMAAALASFYHQVPVAHVEAGLRTYDRYSPFPEEMNRKIISAIATYHFAPTETNRAALEREGIVDHVHVTGNTVIDAFQYTTHDDYEFGNGDLTRHNFSKPTILMTAHRRENLGTPLENICDAVNELCALHPDVTFVYPVHLNPVVRETVFAKLQDNPQVKLIDPVDVEDMHNAMARSVLVLTDSGGLQEEAPHLGKPVVVLRTETERPEAVAAGTAVVAGVDKDRIVRIVDDILSNDDTYQAMANATNPYGDGHASERILEILKESF
ncbi:UDP-N-acetylglucosamine 2-epimerase (non-hydrolyzing) [Eggerthella lenta]|uniref:UDP-N-acetylglucosamine 2-epimerase (non-hydrolyzing) n=1 Tax=Eggerthella lenta TaxID=84112 RepID=A0A5C5BUA4_EGGLN|nr:UDP-N-acetylglucosamine 2-epimerase (non-hydrolyzing) [Eggerthella lenta]TNU89934.1 UDP-N-acetylglucosamine 2-epimerase (non-hydrolyzing) [Eggerthella lenta]